MRHYTSTFPTLSGALALKVRDCLHAQRLDIVSRARQGRQELHRLIAQHAVNGRVAVVESGMDCDGVQYDGRVHEIDATVADFDALHDQIARWADGPFSLRVASLLDHIEYRSRDRAAEAFENGHAHYLELASLDD